MVIVLILMTILGMLTLLYLCATLVPLAILGLLFLPLVWVLVKLDEWSETH